MTTPDPTTAPRPGAPRLNQKPDREPGQKPDRAPDRESPPTRPRSAWLSRLSWLVLGALLAATLAGTLTFDRGTWPGLVGDEATYLMQAQSLAFDGDLHYDAGDYRRFVGLWHTPPEGLILQSDDDGATISFGKPSFYAIAIAPFVRLAPVRGPFVANALLLALAGVAAALALRRRIGPAAPLWVAAFLFASVTFAYVFWAHADLFLMVLAALALALAFGERPGEAGAGSGSREGSPEGLDWSLLRWAGAGALLAPIALSRPFYATLYLPVALRAAASLRGAPGRRRWPRVAALAAGAALVALPAVGISLTLHGHWTSYSGERMGFYSYTGFPGVDFPAAEWAGRLAQRGGAGSWAAARSFKIPVLPRVTAWNALYFLAGRDVGLLPYYLPLLLGLAAFRPGRGRWALLVAIAATAACFLYVRPFNFYGGGGSIANRYVLPVYPAFWFLAAAVEGRWRRSWAVAAPVVVALAAAPFLLPLWSAPRAYPHLPGGGYRYLSPAARWLLPYETTLDHLKPSGHEDVRRDGLWIKSLGPELDPDAPGGWLAMSPGPHGGATGELLVGSPRRLRLLRIEFAPPGPERVEVEGCSVEPAVLPSAGGSAFLLTPAAPRARHRMWWTDRPVWLYRWVIAVPPGQVSSGEPVRFRLVPSPPAE